MIAKKIEIGYEPNYISPYAYLKDERAVADFTVVLGAIGVVRAFDIHFVGYAQIVFGSLMFVDSGGWVVHLQNSIYICR